MKVLLLSIGLFLIFSCNNKDNCTEKSIVKIQKPKITEIEIKYAYTILYVSNVPKAIDFYKKAFGFEQKFLTPENDYGEIISGTTTISFANFELGNSNLKKVLQRVN
ncbi:VOC family protein [Aquimarina mytili]|uniref:VOC family protein n=1 Tax=Aquimarina mytili TaxID=874423 RepID=A0A937A8F6_9FLAO|nr:VOC family protein [Aquimarina mytili]MBL0686134.1 VOC family protein [Aquimarina mytili]